MNVEIGTESPLFLFWEYLFQNFGILSLQCGSRFFPLPGCGPGGEDPLGPLPPSHDAALPVRQRSGDYNRHRLNMEVDHQSLFGLHVT